MCTVYGVWYLVIAFGLSGITSLILIFLFCYNEKVASSKFYQTHMDVLDYTTIITFILSNLATIICLIVAITCTLQAKSKVFELQQMYPTYSYYAELVEDANDLGDLAQNSKYLDVITQYNEQVAHIKTDREVMGCFSMYCTTDTSQLKMIEINI